MVVNRVGVERYMEKLILLLFWGMAIFLLYLTMIPSKKT
jgi:hypothetical protein